MDVNGACTLNGGLMTHLVKLVSELPCLFSASYWVSDVMSCRPSFLRLNCSSFVDAVNGYTADTRRIRQPMKTTKTSLCLNNSNIQLTHPLTHVDSPDTC